MVWLTDKRLFALLAHFNRSGDQEGAVPPIPATYLVQGGGCLSLPGVSGAAAGDGAAEDGHPWFLKNANVDSCNDNHCLATFEACLQRTACTGMNRQERMQAYVVQPHISRPMLLDGHKFDIRLHVVVVARKGGKVPAAPTAAAGAPAGPLLQAFLFEDATVKP